MLQIILDKVHCYIDVALRLIYMSKLQSEKKKAQKDICLVDR